MKWKRTIKRVVTTLCLASFVSLNLFIVIKTFALERGGGGGWVACCCFFDYIEGNTCHGFDCGAGGGDGDRIDNGIKDGGPNCCEENVQCDEGFYGFMAGTCEEDVIVIGTCINDEHEIEPPLGRCYLQDPCI